MLDLNWANKKLAEIQTLQEIVRQKDVAFQALDEVVLARNREIESLKGQLAESTWHGKMLTGCLALAVATILAMWLVG